MNLYHKFKKINGNRLAQNSASQFANKLIVGAVGLISVPILLNYLGSEKFGLWAAVTSILGLVGWMDFGLGSEVMNKLLVASSQNDRERQKRIVSASLLALTSISLLLFLSAQLLNYALNWAELLNASIESGGEVRKAVAVLIIFVVVGLPLSVVDRARFAFQENYIVSLLQALASVISLLLLVYLVQFNASLPQLLVGLLLPNLVFTFLNGLHLLSLERPWLRPKISLVSRAEVRSLMTRGSHFLILQLLAAITFGIDAFIVAKTQDLEAVSAYSVHARLFSIVQVFLMVFVSPLWVAFGDAFARGDFVWIREVIRKGIRGILVAGILLIVSMLLIGPYLLNFWVGNLIQPSYPLMVALSSWTIVMSIGALAAALLNATGQVKIQIKLCLLLLPIMSLIKYLSSKYFGTATMVFSGTVCYLVLCAIPLYRVSVKTVAQV